MSWCVPTVKREPKTAGTLWRFPHFHYTGDKMRFFNIKDDYIAFLRQYDSLVQENKNERRPYVGVVLEIGDVRYFAPFTSPKRKHASMKNGKDFRKIAGGKYGAINFNNMIPVCDEALLPIDFVTVTDPQYRRLLQNQYKAIKNDREAIKKTACDLRMLYGTIDDDLGKYELSVKSRCCNFPLLESVYKNYTSTSTI